MKKISSAAVFFAFVFFVSVPACAAGGAMIRMEHIPDPQMNNAVAATIALPEGWKVTQGQVTWNYNTYADFAHVTLLINTKADDAGVFIISPWKYSHGGIGNLGYPLKQPVSAEDYAKELLNLLFGKNNRNVSDFRVTKVNKPQNYLNSMNELASVKLQVLTAAGHSVSGAADFAHVEFTYFLDGRGYEAEAMLGTTYIMAGPATFWETTPIIIAGAHEGKAKVYANDIVTIIGNSSLNPAWVETVERLQNQLIQESVDQSYRDMMATDAMLKQQLQNTHDHISRNQRDVFNNRRESMSNVMSGWTDTFSGRERWRSYDGTYSTPSGYDYVWQNSNGDMLPSNDSTFNPNYSSSYSGDWTQMEKIPW